MPSRSSGGGGGDKVRGAQYSTRVHDVGGGKLHLARLAAHDQDRAITVVEHFAQYPSR